MQWQLEFLNPMLTSGYNVLLLGAMHASLFPRCSHFSIHMHLPFRIRRPQLNWGIGIVCRNNLHTTTSSFTDHFSIIKNTSTLDRIRNFTQNYLSTGPQYNVTFKGRGGCSGERKKLHNNKEWSIGISVMSLMVMRTSSQNQQGFLSKRKEKPTLDFGWYFDSIDSFI